MLKESKFKVQTARNRSVSMRPHYKWHRRVTNNISLDRCVDHTYSECASGYGYCKSNPNKGI